MNTDIQEQLEKVEWNLTNHPPQTDQVKMRMESIRAQAKGLANAIATDVPTSHEKSLAQTRIEEAVMWAMAALARRQEDG